MKSCDPVQRHCRWIVPYSEQFRFIVLCHCPFLPRKARCKLMESWLHSRYRSSRMEHMVPSVSTPQNFTGQCNDAFFQYAKEVMCHFWREVW